MKCWQVVTDDGLFFYQAETRGKARVAFMNECYGDWWDAMHIPIRRCAALDGLEPTMLNAIRVGAVTSGYADCGCSIYAEDDSRLYVVGDEVFCSAKCAAEIYRRHCLHLPYKRGAS